MTVAVVIPWRGGCPHREVALGWVLDRCRYAGWTAVVGECPPGPWSKARAVAVGLARTDANLIAICDADVWTSELGNAVQAVRDGATWAMPHRTVHRLTAESTAAVLAGAEPSRSMAAEQRHTGVNGGGAVVLRRTTYRQIPLDPRFNGWGAEDTAWADALSTLAGSLVRGPADLFHLWHPPQPRQSRNVGSSASLELRARYKAATGNQAQMRELLAEAWEAGP
jgi:hypothetical protein